MQTTTRHRKGPLIRERRSIVNLSSAIFLLLILSGIGYALYTYQVKPLLTMDLPDHDPLLIDTPPTELTSFEIRSEGNLLTPCAVAITGDSLYLSFVGSSRINVYSADLKLVKQIQLERPEVVVPTSMAVTDSFLIVADSVKQTVVLYDRDGYYQNSSGWYPQQVGRISPTHLSANLGMLLLIDSGLRRVAVISLIDRQPFYTFLELVKFIPDKSLVPLPAPSCAILTPDSNVWIGDRTLGRGFIFAPSGKILSELEQPQLSKIASPADFALSWWNSPSAGPPAISNLQVARIHMLDREAGKVFVYDLNGRLTLVYPRDRLLNQPTSIAVNQHRRQIYIAESTSKEVTVFGF